MTARNDLDGNLGKHIRQICGNGYHSDADNHCAHFVSHMLGYSFGYTCGDTTNKRKGSSASLRVHELFAECAVVGKWSELGSTSACLVFITNERHVHLATQRMDNVPQKHVGIYLNGTIWHYSNSRHQVVSQLPDIFSHHYSGKGIAMFYGTFPALPA